MAYNAASGVFTVTGANLDNHGSANGIAMADFTLNAGKGKYVFSAANDIVSKLTATGFTVTLSSADKTSVNSYVTDNGAAPAGSAAYNLTATANWDSDSGAKITTQGVTVSGLLPTVLGVAYNAATGILSLAGHNLTTTAAGYLVADMSLKGDGNTSYTLSSGSTVLGTPTSTGVNIQLSVADQLAIDGLLNKAGTQANDGLTNYNFSAIKGWDTGAAAVSSAVVTVSNVTAPTISSVAYNAATGALTLSGANLVNHGSAGGIAVADFTLSGGNGSYTFSAANDKVSNLSAGGFTLTLSSLDQAAVSSFITANGTGPTSGNAYNLSATANWDSDSGAKITTQAVNVSGVSAPLPTVSGAAYNAATGVLTLSGFNFTTSAVGYLLNDLTIKGDGNTSYTLAVGMSGNSAISGTPTSTSVSIQLSTFDQLAVNGLLNNNGVIANDTSTTYNLSGLSGWDTGAGSFSSGITVSNVTAPTISNVAYNAATGVFTVTGANLDNHGNANGIALGDFGLTGGGSSFAFSAVNDSVSNLSATGFTITLSSADQTAVNNIMTANGTAPASGAAYNFTSTANWDSDSGLLIGKQAVNVSGAAINIISSGGFINPQGIAFDSAGNIYVTDFAGNSIKEIAAGSHVVSTLLTVNQPSGLAIDKAGNFYVSEFGNNIVQEFAAGSLTPTTIATGLNAPMGVALDGSGNVYVVNSGNFSIDQITHTNYLLSPTASTALNNLWENTGQIDISKAVFSAFSGASAITPANFSNASAATSATDYLFYNAANGGLYYDPDGSGSMQASLVAVVGVNSHPASLSLGDFSLTA